MATKSNIPAPSVPGAPLPPNSTGSGKLQTWRLGSKPGILQETRPKLRAENESQACRLSTRVSNECPTRCCCSADPGLVNSTPGPRSQPGSGLSQNWTPVSICSCVRHTSSRFLSVTSSLASVSPFYRYGSSPALKDPASGGRGLQDRTREAPEAVSTASGAGKCWPGRWVPRPFFPSDLTMVCSRKDAPGPDPNQGALRTAPREEEE